MTDLNIAELEDELQTARGQKDINGEIIALRQLGSFYQKNRKLTKAASCLSKALNIVEKTENAGDKAVVFANLGCVYWEMAQLKKAMTHFQEALKIQRQIQDVTGQTAVLILLGISHWRKCQWEEGLSYFREAFDTQKTHDRKTEKSLEDEGYYSLSEAMERGVATLQNRVRLGQEQNDPLKILQPMFSMVPLVLFTGRVSEVEPLLQEAGSLAERLQKKDILDVIPKLRGLVRDFC